VSRPTPEAAAPAARWWLVTVVLSLVVAADAHAYLDGGSGSMMLQLLLGGLAGVGVVARLYWHRVLGFFGRRDPAQAGTDEPDPEA
jgi:hypothetical protein